MADIGGDQRDAAHQVGPVGREHARDAVAEGVTGDQRGAAAVALDHRRDVGGAIMQIGIGRGTAARADAARLRPQHAIAGGGDPLRHDVEIGRATAERRQQHERVAGPLRQHLDADGPALNDGRGDGRRCAALMDQTLDFVRRHARALLRAQIGLLADAVAAVADALPAAIGARDHLVGALLRARGRAPARSRVVPSIGRCHKA